MIVVVIVIMIMIVTVIVIVSNHGRAKDRSDINSALPNLVASAVIDLNECCCCLFQYSNALNGDKQFVFLFSTVFSHWKRKGLAESQLGVSEARGCCCTSGSSTSFRATDSPRNWNMRSSPSSTTGFVWNVCYCLSVIIRATIDNYCCCYYYYCYYYYLLDWLCSQDTISVHRPGFYAQRFQNFFSNTVFKKIPSCESRD